MVSAAGEVGAAGAASGEGAAPAGEAELAAVGGGVHEQQHQACKCQTSAIYKLLPAMLMQPLA